MTRLARARKIISQYTTQPIVKLIARTPVTPDTLTWLGFLLTVASAVLVVNGNLFIAGLVVLFAGFFDMLDGALARITNRVTRFGGVLDSTLDRLSEAVVMLGILVVYAREQQVWASLLVGVTLVGSFMVSYLRARVEALGIECREGVFTRPERVIILSVGLLLSRFDYALVIALSIIALFSFLTVGQRLVYAWRRTRD